ncbi:MAG: DUF2189 domain-containing protein [Rhodocyclaceae bacterium]|nr:DUF2189 domain-containing protein [Rhodocyclaceae bacterium]
MSPQAQLQHPAPQPRAVGPRALLRAFAAGWQVLARAPRPSLCFGAAFTVAGTLLVWGAQALHLAAMTIPLLGGFLLFGPVLSAGLLGVSSAVRHSRPAGVAAILGAIRGARRGLWALSLFCLLMFLIWLSDAGTLYSFMLGERSQGLAAALPLDPRSLRFHAASAATGFVIANLVFAVTAHSVPLLVRGRASLVGAVMASVRATFRSPLAHALWALALAAGVFASLLLPPLLIVSLPLLAYTGDALHVEIFGDARRKPR